MGEGINPDKAVAAYVQLRDAIADMEDRHKAELSPLKEQFELVGNAILEHCVSNDLEGFKTPSGTVTRRLTTRYWTNDWETFNRFVLDNEAPELFEKRIHTGNMAQFLEENPDALPAGLQTERKYAVTVRRATKKE